MKLFRLAALGLVLCLGLSFGLADRSEAAPPPKVKIETSLGDFVVELYPDKAPKTVSNFLFYVKSGFYDGTIFHRVIDGFMIQGGGMTADMREKPNKRKPVANEASNGLKNRAYTLAMARTSDPHSATSQFFVNVADNAFLDYTSSTPSGYGYAVFGKVVEGQDVIDRIKRVPTGSAGMHQNVPKTPVVIERVVPVL